MEADFVYLIKRGLVFTLTRLADNDGADCPRLEFLIRTRLLSTMEPAKREESHCKELGEKHHKSCGEK